MMPATNLNDERRPMGAMRIFVIDNSEEFRTQLRRILMVGMTDAKVQLHDPIEEGLPHEEFDWSDYDAIILEHDLGEAGDGLEWLYHRIQSGRLPPVVVLTGRGDQYLAVRAMKAGASDYLHKSDLSQGRIVTMVRQAVQDVASATNSGEGTISRTLSGNARSIVSAAPSVVKPKNKRLEGIRGYRIVKEIGEGATAKVYLAERLKDKLMVVLKVMDEALIEDNEFLERFLMEADLVLTIDSPHVVKIYEQAFTDEGPFIAMEHLAGGDLRKHIGRGVTSGEAVDYFIQIVRGLDAIHSLGIVHRDLKPANIMFRSNGTLAIVDFGISKLLENTNSLTEAGAVLGTPYYVSPEQGHGDTIDTRSDYYSAGVIWYEMLTGRKVFIGDTPAAVVYQHIYEEPPKLPDSVKIFQPIMDRLLAKKPGDRIGSLEELIVAFG